MEPPFTERPGTLTSSRSPSGRAPRVSRITILQTVGGAQSVLIGYFRSVSRREAGEKRVYLWTKIVAPAFQGAKKELQECLAHPGELMFRWRSPSFSPIQYIVERCPTG